MSTHPSQRPPNERPFTDGPAQLAAELKARSGKSNPYTASIVDLVPFKQWAEQWVTAKNRPYRFDEWPYLHEIADVFADQTIADVTLVKAVQVGGSELLTRLMLYMALRQPLSGMYLFPARSQMADFYDARLRSLIENNPDLQRHLLGVSNKGLMRFGPSHLYFRGAESIRDVISVDVDLLILDEYDLLLQANLLEAERRIAASRNPMVRRIGVPTELGYGIWACYQDSDQRRWHVSCPNCLDEQILGFEQNVSWKEGYGRILEERLTCRACGETLDPRAGRWIAQHPERSIPGFHVSRLMVPTVNLKSLIEASKQQGQLARQKFFMNDLGEPYSEPLAGLTVADITAAVDAGTAANNGIPLHQASSYSGQHVVTVGVDPAGIRLFRVRVSEHLNNPNDPTILRRALYIGTVSDWIELYAICRRFEADVICIDAGSEQHSAAAFADNYPASVFLVHELFMPTNPLRIDLETTRIKVDRTFLLDAAIEALRLGHNHLPNDLPRGYVDEMTSPRRALKEVHGRRYGHYEKRGDDDYAHAEAFDYLAGIMVKLAMNGSAYEEVSVPFEVVIPGFRRTFLGPGFPPPSHTEDDLEFGSPAWPDPSPGRVEEFDQDDDLEFGSPAWWS